MSSEVPIRDVPERPDQRRSFDDADVRDALNRVLPVLPARQRATLVLRYFEDLSEADVAAALGCSIGTVKSQSAEALAKLRVLLATDEAQERLR
jgi:RNA polymerase sigma factor (sigma-70 family)